MIKQQNDKKKYGASEATKTFDLFLLVSIYIQQQIVRNCEET